RWASRPARPSGADLGHRRSRRRSWRADVPSSARCQRCTSCRRTRHRTSLLWPPLHVAGSLVMPGLDGEPTAPLLEDARARGLHTSLDTGYDATARWGRVESCLRHLDLVAPNLVEGQAISGETEPARVAAWLRERGVRDVALTLGPPGSYVAGAGYEGFVP